MGRIMKVVIDGLIWIILLFYMFPCHANDIEMDNTDDNAFRFRYGIRAGLGFGYFDSLSATCKSGEDDSANIGGSVGLAIRYENPTRWYFESGLTINYASGAVSLRNLQSNFNSDMKTEECNMSRLALQVPLIGGCKFCLVDEFLWMSFFAGPTLSVGLTGSIDTPENLPNYSLYGNDAVWRRFNVAATFGASFEIDNRFSVNVTGSLGLNSMPRADIFRYRNATESEVRVSATYWLQL